MILTEWELASSRRKTPDPEMRRRSLAHVKERLALSPPVRNPYHLALFCDIAVIGGDTALARAILAEWERLHPKDLEAPKMRVAVDFLDGAYGRAIKGARKVLEKKKNDPDLDRLISTAVQKLQQEARENEGPPPKQP